MAFDPKATTEKAAANIIKLRTNLDALLKAIEEGKFEEIHSLKRDFKFISNVVEGDLYLVGLMQPGVR